MNNNKQIEKIAHKILGNATEYGSKNAPIGSRERSYYETEVNGIVKGINWQKQQDEAKYKELLDSHNELLEAAIDIEWLFSNGADSSELRESIYLKLKPAFLKAKNIKL
jgi:hypothetical protein